MWTKYNYINTLELLGQLDNFLMTGDTPNYEFMAIDTETNGLFLHKASVIGFSISVDSQKGFYIPLVEWIPDESSKKVRTINKQKYEVFEHGHFKCVWTGNTYREFFMPHEYQMPEFIPALIYRWCINCKLVMHNAPFDINHIFTITRGLVDLTPALFLDTALLSHILNENSLNGLKETANEWRAELGINPHQMANQEQKELGLSIVRNGGEITKGGKPKTIWRAEPHYQNKYACADTFLTYGLLEVGLQKLEHQFGEQGFRWIFEEEVMPVCKEVVIPMKRNGVFTDQEHFKLAAVQTKQKLIDLEDQIIQEITPNLDGFSIGKSIDEEISNQRLIKRIIELEGLSIPTKFDKKSGKDKETLAKGVVKKVYQSDPHWIWGYILGEDEIKYSDEKIKEIKQQLYEEVTGKRYRFNIGSDAHLRWLFCDKFGMDKKSLPQTDSATSDNPIPSMKAEVLQEFMLKDHPWVHNLLIFKKLRKLYSTYIMPAIDLNINGWLYMDMRQNGTVSGRFACSGGFNLQTLPNIENELETLKQCDKCDSFDVVIHQEIEALAHRECKSCGHIERDIICSSVVKKGFIAPPGYKIINADYSSLEPRCFAYMSGDDKLKEVYWKGLDLYSKVYCDVFDKEGKYSAHPDDANFLKKLDKQARTRTKPIVLGIPYGANKFQVATLTGKTVKKTNNDGSVSEFPDTVYGQSVIDQYLGTYENLSIYMEKMELDCLTKGYVEALCGRRRHFQYAPKIYRFLKNKNMSMTHRDFIDVSPRKMNKANCSYISDRGIKVDLTENELKALVKDLGLPYENCVKKDYWCYIRNILKADVNNAKNFPIQALAGHITNRGMLETTRLFKQNGIPGWVCLQVHDEITSYAPIELAEPASQCLKIGMEDNIYAKKIDVPMIADPIICDNVKDAK